MEICGSCGAEKSIKPGALVNDCLICGDRTLGPVTPPVEDLNNICRSCRHPIAPEHDDFGCHIEGCPCTFTGASTVDKIQEALPNAGENDKCDACKKPTSSDALHTVKAADGIHTRELCAGCREKKNGVAICQACLAAGAKEGAKTITHGQTAHIVVHEGQGHVEVACGDESACPCQNAAEHRNADGLECPKGNGQKCQLIEEPGGDDAKGYWFKCDRCGRRISIPGRENTNTKTPGDRWDNATLDVRKKWLREIGGWGDDAKLSWEQLDGSEKNTLQEHLKAENANAAEPAIDPSDYNPDGGCKKCGWGAPGTGHTSGFHKAECKILAKERARYEHLQGAERRNAKKMACPACKSTNTACIVDSQGGRFQVGSKPLDGYECHDCENMWAVDPMTGQIENSEKTNAGGHNYEIDRDGDHFGRVTESEAPNESALRSKLVSKGAMTDEEAKAAKFFVSDKGVGFQFAGGGFVHLRCYCDECYNSLSNADDKGPYDQPNALGCNGCDDINAPLNRFGYCQRCASKQGPIQNADGWKNGTVEHGGKRYKYQARVFDEGSQYGIDGGKVSKLFVTPADSDWSQTVIEYDRGWSRQPGSEHKPILDKLLQLFNARPDFEKTIAAFEAHCKSCAKCGPVRNAPAGAPEADAKNLCPDGARLLVADLENSTPEHQPHPGTSRQPEKFGGPKVLSCDKHGQLGIADMNKVRPGDACPQGDGGKISYVDLKNSDRGNCEYCKGKGMVPADSNPENDEKCPRCHGTGNVEAENAGDDDLLKKNREAHKRELAEHEKTLEMATKAGDKDQIAKAQALVDGAKQKIAAADAKLGEKQNAEVPAKGGDEAGKPGGTVTIINSGNCEACQKAAGRPLDQVESADIFTKDHRFHLLAKKTLNPAGATLLIGACGAQLEVAAENSNAVHVGEYRGYQIEQTAANKFKISQEGTELAEIEAQDVNEVKRRIDIWAGKREHENAAPVLSHHREAAGQARYGGGNR